MGRLANTPFFSKMARIVVPQIQELTIFGCCKQSLTRLYHPSIHPASPIVFMGLIPNFYFINFKKAFFLLSIYLSIYLSNPLVGNFFHKKIPFEFGFCVGNFLKILKIIKTFKNYSISSMKVLLIFCFC